MKGLPFYLLAAGLLLAASPAGAQTLEHLHLVCASYGPVGTDYNISVSKDGAARAYDMPYIWDATGRLWRQLNDPFLGDSLTDGGTKITPSGVIFDRLSNGWLTRSEDGGLSFIRISAPSGFLPSGFFLISPVGELFLLNNTETARSTDNGQTWDSLPSSNRYFSNYYFDAAGNLIQVGNPNLPSSTIYRLARGSKAFDSIGICSIRFTPVFISCSLDSNSLLLAVPDSLYSLNETNGQIKALPLPKGSFDPEANMLCCDSSGHLFIGIGPSLFRSDDTGHTWTRIESGGRDLSWVAFQPPSSVWYATDSHVMQYSTSTKSQIACDSPFETLDVWSLTAKADTVYALTEDDSGIFQSLDDGNTWKQITPDSSLWWRGSGEGSRICFSPTGATYIAGIGYNFGNVFRSYGGQQWESITNSLPELYDPTTIVDSAGSIFYITDEGISDISDISTDDGNTWTSLALPNLYYAGVTYYGFLCWAADSFFHYTPDKGQTWNYSSVNDTLARGNAFIHSAAGRIWLAYDSVLELSTDAGSTWMRAMNALSHSPLQEITTDPRGHTFCIQGYFQPNYGWPTTCSIYAWNPSQQSWSQLTPDTMLTVYSFCANSKYLFLGTQSGVFRIRVADFDLDVAQTPSPSMEPTIAYPDPASKQFWIRCYLSESSHVKVTLYDVLGNAVKRVEAGTYSAGWNTIPISERLPSGTYTYEIESNGSVTHGRIALEP